MPFFKDVIEVISIICQTDCFGNIALPAKTVETTSKHRSPEKEPHSNSVAVDHVVNVCV